MHLLGRSLRGVMIRQPLEQRASIRHRWGHCRQTGQPSIVADDEEPTHTTFEIGLGIPCNFIALATPGRHPNVERRKWWSDVSNGSVLDVFDPDLGYLFVRQPGRFKRVALVGRSRHSRLAKEGR